MFIVFFEHQPKFGQKWAKKNDNFSHFPKHRFIKKKKRFVATPRLTKNWCFSTFFETKNIDVEQKT